MKWAIRFAIFFVLAGTALCLAVALYVIATTNSRIYASASTAPTAEVALVLGASVSSKGVLSAVLQQRVDQAIELYRKHLVKKILVTGDDGSLLYDEVYPMGKYLLAAGIPQADIFLDYAGFDTYSSMYRARDVFGVTSVLVVSQRFHLPRAIFIARHLGLDAYGVDAAPHEPYFKNSLREIPASVKAVIDLLGRRVPKYLGQQFPVSGDGTQTWVGDKSDALFLSTE